MTRTTYQLLVFVLCIALTAILGVAFYFYFSPLDSDRRGAIEAREVVAAVGEHIILPAEEEPTVATVTSLEPLTGQPFFANAKIGYKVLIYTNAKMVYLYDPVSDKLINVAPLNIGTTSVTAP